MRLRRFLLCLFVAVQFADTSSFAQQTRFKVLAFYSENAEPDHVRFAQDAVKFLTERAANEHFTVDATTNWRDLNDERLKGYQLVIWLNESPTNTEQRNAFERYIKDGGAWLGFHAAGYNDKDTNWPWFVDFLGGAVFYTNSWPPLPARLVIDDQVHPLMAGAPRNFESPANEWYIWKPSPRLDKAVRVLATFDASNYPIGFKDVLTGGDLPVIWTNTKHKMLYVNMGHGDKIFTSPTQNQIIDNAVNWLATGAAQETAPRANGIRISPQGIGLNPQTGKFYCVSTSHDAVTVIDGDGHLLTRVQVGQEPESIAVNPDTNRIYVANSGSGTVTVLDGATDKAITNVTVGNFPYIVAVNGATNTVYVSRTFSNVTTIIDGRTNVARTLRSGVGDAVDAVSLDNNVYLLSYETPEVMVLDAMNDRLSSIKASNHLWAIAANPVTKKIYAVSTGSANVTVIDGESHATRVVSTGEIPSAVAVDKRSGAVFVANYASNSVTVIDGLSDSVIATLNVSPHPQAIAVDSNNHKVYVASTRAGTITVLDGTANSVLTTMKTGKALFTIAVNNKTHKAVALGIDGDVAVIDGSRMSWRLESVTPGSSKRKSVAE